MWELALSDRSFPGASSRAIFEGARRVGIPRVFMGDGILGAPRGRRWWPWGGQGTGEWRGVSEWGEALDYSRRRLHALRLERLQAGVRLVGWAIAPRPPGSVEMAHLRAYVLGAAAAASFLGARGVLVEGMDRWAPEEALDFLRLLLPALTGLRLALWVRLVGDALLLSEVVKGFPAAVRPWIALDLEGRPPEDFPALWTAIAPYTAVVLLRCEPEVLAWWRREGGPTVRGTGFAGVLGLTCPGILGKAREGGWGWAQADGLLP